MNTNQNLLTHLQIVAAISSLPDDATISAEIAALYLGTSLKSLARLRQNNDGPKYTQYPKIDSVARNQRVNYIMRDLREWRNARIVTSSMDAAVKRGMAFSRVNDLLIPQPFWRSKSAIINHVFCLTIEELYTYLNDPDTDVVWVKWSKALSQKWKINAVREPFFSGYIKLLSGLIEAAKQEN